jgi:hypothetical protein
MREERNARGHGDIFAQQRRGGEEVVMSDVAHALRGELHVLPEHD